jgi:hypothetical protein
MGARLVLAHFQAVLRRTTMSRMAKFLILAAIASYSILVFATAQQGDVLLLDGKKYSIYTNPLEPYLQANPGKLPKSDVVSTGLWRGYVANWEIKGDRLLLVDVGVLKFVEQSGQKGFSTELNSVMSRMFPNEKTVLAKWFSGHIIVPNGKLVHYVHMGYASTYEKYIVLRIEKGSVTRKWETDTQEFIKFRDSQFALFKNTKEYRKALADSAKEGGMSPEENEEFLREFYSERYMSMIFDNQR